MMRQSHINDPRIITYLPLSKGKNRQAQNSMKIAVRRTMSSEYGRQFEEVSYCSNEDLRPVEDDESQPDFLVRISEVANVV